jgi:hypothetical protein
MIVIFLVAVALSVLLSLPTVNLMFIVITFGAGLFFMIGAAFFAFLGPIAVLLAALTSFLKLTSWRVFRFAVVLWISAFIVHVGQTHGRSRWGDVGSTIGGKNEPYKKLFWEPVVFIETWVSGLRARSGL